MEKQFTASEVRDLAKRGTDAMQQFIDGRHTLHVPPQPDDADMVIAKCLRAMDAFADMLEAQEKAVPVGYVHKGYLDRDCLNEELYVTRNRVRDDQLPLYAHPFPSDAEQPSIPDLTDDEWMILFHERPDLKIRLNAIFDRADYLSRYRSQCKTKIAPVDERAVPVATCGHSSTVEHRASNANVVGSNPIARSNSDAERLAEALRNGLIDALRHQRQIDEDGAEVGVSRQAIDEAAAILSALAAHYAQSQPPAASVTDEMVMRLKHALPLFCADVTMADARAALEAALAAQENPNG